MLRVSRKQELALCGYNGLYFAKVKRDLVKKKTVELEDACERKVAAHVAVNEAAELIEYALHLAQTLGSVCRQLNWRPGEVQPNRSVELEQHVGCVRFCRRFCYWTTI